jgi:hypothetical protein
VQKFLVVFNSANHKTGEMLVTTSPRATCPAACPLRRSAGGALRCYADRGYLGQYIWGGLDRTPPGGTFGNNIPVYTFAQLLLIIRCLRPGSVWRHNQAGDLHASDGTIDADSLEKLVAANHGRRGFTFTHHDVLASAANRCAVREANRGGFRINLSANDLHHADALYDTGAGPVAVIVPRDQRANTVTPKGRAVVVCPARTHPGTTCATCRLCARPRDVIVGFPALTPNRKEVPHVLEQTP